MTTQPLRGWAASGVLAGTLALSGCGAGDDKSGSAPPARAATKTATATATATAALPASLGGTWKRRMRARDWKAVGQGYPLGTWRFDVTRKGTVDLYLPRTSTVDFSPEFAVAGDRLTIGSVPVCPGKTSRYTWRASGDELTLKVVADGGCAAAAALFGGTWHH